MLQLPLPFIPAHSPTGISQGKAGRDQFGTSAIAKKAPKQLEIAAVVPGMLSQAGMGTLSSPCKGRSVSELELTQLQS